MALSKTKGIVVKEIPFNDTDKMLTLITTDLGKISVLAKNSRRGGSRSSYGTQVLTYGEYVLFRGKGAFTLNSCDAIVNYYDLANDLTRFTYAAHMLDMADDAANDPMSSAQVLNTLLHGLHALKKGRNPLLVSSAFALKLMQIMGYPPHITCCAVCGTKEIDQIYFSFKNSGFICETCAKQEPDAITVEIGAAKAILHVLCAQNSGIFNFELSSEVLDVFSRIALKYIEIHMEKKYKKIEFLKDL